MLKSNAKKINCQHSLNRRIFNYKQWTWNVDVRYFQIRNSGVSCLGNENKWGLRNN